ncbi:MAG: MptD family putative ECF transporter S component, partial [Mogibacterium sp.]|nr:MptD family putative ECF transporter S component [Mogibacterium sp.]
MPLLFSFVYLYTAANMQCFGAATVLNGFVLIVGLIVGEGNPAMITGLILLAAFAEIIRKATGYGTKKGVELSFIPFAFSFYAYAAHWWTNTEESLTEAVEEMSPGYADMMQSVIDNTSVLIVMLILTVP